MVVACLLALDRRGCILFLGQHIWTQEIVLSACMNPLDIQTEAVDGLMNKSPDTSSVRKI